MEKDNKKRIEEISKKIDELEELYYNEPNTSNLNKLKTGFKQLFNLSLEDLKKKYRNYSIFYLDKSDNGILLIGKYLLELCDINITDYPTEAEMNIIITKAYIYEVMGRVYGNNIFEYRYYRNKAIDTLKGLIDYGKEALYVGAKALREFYTFNREFKKDINQTMIMKLIYESLNKYYLYKNDTTKALIYDILNDYESYKAGFDIDKDNLVYKIKNINFRKDHDSFSTIEYNSFYRVDEKKYDYNLLNAYLELSTTFLYKEGYYDLFKQLNDFLEGLIKLTRSRWRHRSIPQSHSIEIEKFYIVYNLACFYIKHNPKHLRAVGNRNNLTYAKAFYNELFSDNEFIMDFRTYDKLHYNLIEYKKSIKGVK